MLDGAMGTQIQQYGLTEADFRGKRFAKKTKNLHLFYTTTTLAEIHFHEAI